ncbi:MAG: signal recognition particle-docking protein FtsY [Candidatus Diapherotrites archaeon]|nr:signal recognition particle-docking protein FtsY [Candidatus Diapherotrites archaeon]MDZ4256553.1 signal recognition particle-docking protein FtsY [archaeon]
MFDLLKKKIAGFTQKVLGNVETQKPADPTPPESDMETGNANDSEVNLPQMPEESPVPDKVMDAIPDNVMQADEITRIAESEDQPAQPSKLKSEALPEMKGRDERPLTAKVGIISRMGGMLTGTLTLDEETVKAFLEEFELSLLEADVELETATALVEELHARLSNKTISTRENPTKVILTEIKAALHQIIDVEEVDVDSIVASHHPCIILILGPNGAGKTTTIAKLAHRFQQQGKKVVLASADTFRAGSIEQLQIHANALGVRLVKHTYGADPAAVAYDAVNAARAEKADVVLIDSAGRQDTNKNLLEELKKIQRVIQPHLKWYVGESFTGQAILTQARTFDTAIGVDGFILTKLDTDTKGGGVISVMHALKKPVVFFGVGQGYDDLIPFDMDSFLDRIIPMA